MASLNNTHLTIIGAILVATIIGAYAYEKGLLPTSGSGIVAGQLPACDSPAAQSLLRRAFENAPRIRQQGVTIQRLGVPSQINELKDDAGELLRRGCLAEVFTNAGHSFLGFMMRWANPEKTDVWLEIPVIPF
jgi:hypothetical protein